MDHSFQEDTRTTLTIEARDLDTDARRRTTVEATPPADLAGQREALIVAVTGVFPEAELRSFADGAASFLDSRHLIVASYAEVPRPRRQTQITQGSQQPLFAS
jgi:hypothetical protein